MSTYLDFAIKDKTELCNWIERKLGAPLVRIELTQEHLDDAIDEAMEIYTKYVTPEKQYFSLDLAQFPLSGLTMESNVAGIFALEGNAGFGGGGSGTLFSTRSAMRDTIGGNRGAGSAGSWITYELAGQYLELTKRMTGGGYQFEYNFHTKLLRLDPTPGLSGNNDTGVLVVGANVIRPETEQFGEYWVKRYALALSKITLGYIRSKFQGVALLAGGQIDGDGIKSEGIQERDELMEELMSSEYLPVTFFIG